MEYILEVKNLVVDYGIIRAIKGIDLNVKPGNIVAILGANGAGKTTTIRTVNGLVKAASGEIIFNGEKITNLEPNRLANKGISQSPEGRMILNGLTVEENLNVGAYSIKPEVVNGKKKTLHKGKHVCCFALGNKALYDYLDHNPAVLVLRGSYVNDPAIIGLNDNQVSINSTLEVDLTGQCASESIGTTHFSGTGGQSDTAVGAQKAKNGRSFISLYSTAWVRNPETGEKEEVSKIVPTLKPGAAVSLSRNDVDYVVTEYGIVRLRGTNIRERAKLLISIAHPKFRDELYKEAIKAGFIHEHF